MFVRNLEVGPTCISHIVFPIINNSDMFTSILVLIAAQTVRFARTCNLESVIIVNVRLPRPGRPHVTK